MRLLLVLALAAIVFAYRSIAAGPLDGSAWEVKVKRDSFLALSHADTIVFDRGHLSSARSVSGGCLPSGYSVRTDAGGASFESTQTGHDGSVMEWRGEIRGDRVKGSLVVTRANGKSKQYAFRGRRKV
ncbi:MAG: hypothetical protein WC728_15440 [Elusimicrobiota bacterium]